MSNSTIIKKTKKIKIKVDKDIYKDKPIDELIILKNRLLTELNTTKNIITIKKNNLLLSKIYKVLDKKLSQNDEYRNSFRNDSDFMYYPDYKDPEFNKKIFSKKEFYINRTIPLNSDAIIEEEMNKNCAGFKLNENQKFLKTYISNKTPYNSILLFHGTGRGKTCSSISIAEGLINNEDRKIFILLNPSIEQNFRKNIFNINKFKAGNVLNQCTRDTYLKKIKNFSNLQDLENKVNKLINSNYNFSGYQKFSNRYSTLKNKFLSLGYNDEKVKRKIGEYYSNSVIIIDEVHNIKKDIASTKNIPNQLEELIKYSNNIKLILLSATPMFNSADEILFILNLLLLNNKQPTINRKDVFDKDGNITTEGAKLIAFKSTGIVSFLRGENPLMFPKRLYPTKNIMDISKIPNININNEVIPQENRIKNLKIVDCPMKDTQLEIYKLFQNSKTENKISDSFDNNGILISNIVYPIKSYMNYSDNIDNYDYTKVISNSAFDSMFKKSRVANKTIYSIKSNNDITFLDIDNIGKYSCKIKAIIDNINESTGVVFVYSRYVSTGILTLALALEYNGYSNYNSNLLKLPSGMKPKPKNGLNYTIISGDTDISYKTYEQYLKIENENINGKKIKVILGSESAAEGLDFKYIREVHILEPWHHLNKIEQIIGRGIRFCSHIDLDIKFRNTTIYLYAATNKDSKIETTDLKIYREAENKSKVIADLTYILKTNAVDCNLNLYSNKFVEDVFNKPIDMINSKNQKIKVVLGDNANNNTSICQYRSCDFTCNTKVKRNLLEDEINKDTFDVNNVLDNIYDISTSIISLFKLDSIYTLEQIINHKNITKLNYDAYMIYMAIQYLIDNNINIKDRFNNNGRLIYKGGYYLFEPNYLKNQKILTGDITKPLSIKTKKLNINKLIRKTIIKKDLSKVISLLSQNIDNDLLLFKTINYLQPIDKELLLQEILINLINNTLYENPLLTKCFSILENIIITKSKYKLDDKFDNEYVGYMIFINNTMKFMMYDKISKTFIELDKLTRDRINKIIMVYSKKYIQNNIIKNTNNIIGYLEYNNKNKNIILKIRDFSQIGSKTKKTQISYGSICKNEKETKIRNFIEKLNIELGNIKGKTNLCSKIEDTLIEKELDTNSIIKYYYTLEETFILKPNNKDIKF